MDEQSNVEELPNTPDKNAFIAPELAGAILEFLSRTQIQGNEAEAMVAAKSTMQWIVNSNPQENIQ